MYLLIVSALLLCLSIYFIAKANCSDWLYLMSCITAILAAVTLFISILTIKKSSADGACILTWYWNLSQ